MVHIAYGDDPRPGIRIRAGVRSADVAGADDRRRHGWYVSLHVKRSSADRGGSSRPSRGNLLYQPSRRLHALLRLILSSAACPAYHVESHAWAASRFGVLARSFALPNAGSPTVLANRVEPYTAGWVS